MSQSIPYLWWHRPIIPTDVDVVVFTLYFPTDYWLLRWWWPSHCDFFRPQRISISSAQSSIILIPVHAIFITFLDLHQAHLRLFRSFRGWFAVPAGHHMWMSCWSESPPYTRFGRGLGHVSAPEITKAYLEVIILFIFRYEGISLTTSTDVTQYVLLQW